MPIFEYECLACGHKFEALKRLIDRDSKIKCPNCGSNNPKRVFSIFASKTNTGNSCGSGLPT